MPDCWGFITNLDSYRDRLHTGCDHVAIAPSYTRHHSRHLQSMRPNDQRSYDHSEVPEVWNAKPCWGGCAT